MASGLPTRRTTGRRPDENAPPGVGARSRTTVASLASAAARPKPVTAASGSSIPTLKRNASSNVTAHSASSAAAAAGPAAETSTKPTAAANRKRSALGEVTNAAKAKALAGEEKPAIRRTRTALKEEAPAPAAAPAAKRRPIAGTSRLRTAALSDRRANVKDEAEETKPVEQHQARKKRKTSSPPIIEIEDDDEDLADPAVYDEDGQEVLLSSGGRAGTHMQSPKRVRAKDHGWTDLDAEDEGDPAMVSEYVVDAFNYMMHLEAITMPKADYVKIQAEIQWPMRTVVMDWLIEVHAKFRLLPETLFIATNLVDRFLSIRVVSVEKLQLVGITALFVASKYEEVVCPALAHFLNMTDGGYDIPEMLKAERYLLSSLDFDMSFPNPLHFLRRISKADGYDIQTRTVSKYLIEIGCVDEKLLKFAPSMLAAAAMYLARMCLERGDWTPNLVHYSSYSVEELLPAAQTMLDYILNPDFDPETFFHKKYASKKHMKASVYVRNWALKIWPDSANGTSPDRLRELYVELGIKP